MGCSNGSLSETPREEGDREGVWQSGRSGGTQLPARTPTLLAPQPSGQRFTEQQIISCGPSAHSHHQGRGGPKPQGPERPG